MAGKKYKLKTHKASWKRTSVTGTGRIKHRRVNKGHLMTNTSNKRSRQLRRPGILKGGQEKKYQRLLGVK